MNQLNNLAGKLYSEDSDNKIEKPLNDECFGDLNADNNGYANNGLSFSYVVEKECKPTDQNADEYIKEIIANHNFRNTQNGTELTLDNFLKKFRSE